MELVSILIPCFNSETWIAEAIESALNQTYSYKEVIVVDDGSTDGSLEIIKHYREWIRWETGPNRGGNAARNRLLALSKGTWLQYLDADDYLLPEKLALQMAYLAEQGRTDVLYGRVTKEAWIEGQVTQDLQVITEPHDPWILLARWYLPQTGGSLWRKAALEDVDGWKPDQPCCQEHELYLRLLMAGKRFTYCPHNGAIYRIWSEETVCHKNKPQTRQQRLMILDRAETFLRNTGELSCDRLTAISQARFEMARLTWPEDRVAAQQIVALLLQSNPAFKPLANQPGGHHPPLPYRLLWRFLGFRAAESIGDFIRPLRLTSARKVHPDTGAHPT